MRPLPHGRGSAAELNRDRKGAEQAVTALEATGMFVLTARDGKQALELSRKFPGTIHALVSDIVMPNLDGLGLCEQILRERPAIKVLLMSASGGPVDGVPFLHKPFKLEELKQKVWQLVTGRRSRHSSRAGDRSDGSPKGKGRQSEP
jgi:CheY-like chemotaxis protein